ncbi:unnamed protein product [Anisakis simplex]|uniref:Activin_recp domain-containing protein n=1 Tax=Anisakis simplex TaxID=6269 RepID=A0A0M3K4U5_ANISI|nr:unnamed protein product [Anisakis simplex]
MIAMVRYVCCGNGTIKHRLRGDILSKSNSTHGNAMHNRFETLTAIIQGCISGVDTSVYKMGCRRNFVDAILCLCNDHDHCNNRVDEASLSQMQQIQLPNIQCRNYAEAPYITTYSKENLCTANYCFYAETEVANFIGEREVLTMANCGQLPQYVFDLTISSIWPGPALHTGGCYLLQIQGENLNLGCICAEDSCNAVAPYPVQKGTVKCHLAYGASDEKAVENETCNGDYCLLQKTDHPTFGVQYLKGCLSVNDTMAPSKITVGHRNILGLDHWLCNDDLCNADLKTVTTSIKNPPSTPLQAFTSSSKNSLCLQSERIASIIFVILILRIVIVAE